MLERLVIAVVSLVLAVGLIAVLSGFFASRDQAGVSPSNGPGRQFPDQGHAYLYRGAPRPAYDSNPPTSGPHLPEAVNQDQTELSDDQLLQALQTGNVVIMYGTAAPPPGLAALAQSIAAPFTPQLAAAGQAVILARRPGISGLIALAWDHAAYVSAPNDTLLEQFARFWLGRGAPNR